MDLHQEPHQAQHPLCGTKKDFRVGQMIRIKKHMKPGYHEGEVIRKNTDGTYDVEYGSDFLFMISVVSHVKTRNQIQFLFLFPF